VVIRETFDAMRHQLAKITQLQCATEQSKLTDIQKRKKLQLL
jgi:hypothetical protein